jgi:hypothetical protein
MADTRTATCTELRESPACGNYSLGSVYSRTFSLAVTASDDNTDILTTNITIPANTAILGGAVKSSVAQTNSMTLAVSVGGSAIMTSEALTTSWVSIAGPAIADKDVAMVTADTVVTLTIGGGDAVAGTIWVSLLCWALGTTDSTYSTFTI